jgi:thiamine monophosphate synthase
VIVLLSGRPESTRADTEEWLARQGISYREVILRPERDRRKAADFKAEAIGAIGEPAAVAVVIDDDPAVVERLAGLGYHVEHFR